MKYITGLVGATHLSGKSGGSVASRNAYGTYFKRKGVPIQPNTTKQQLAKGFLTQISQAWKGLTDAQRATWNNNSADFPVTDSLGESQVLTGFNFFNRCNTVRLWLSLPFITDAPTPVSIPAMSNLVPVIQVSSGLITLNFSPSTVGTSSEAIFVRMTRQMSAGRGFVGENDFRLILIQQPGGFSTPLLFATSLYTGSFGTLIAGTRIFVRTQLVNIASGLEGAIIQGSTIVIP